MANKPKSGGISTVESQTFMIYELSITRFLVASQQSWTQLRKCNSVLLLRYHSLKIHRTQLPARHQAADRLVVINVHFC